jgi:hypothetical protein
MRSYAFRKLWLYTLLVVLFLGFAAAGMACIVRTGHGHGHVHQRHGHVHRAPRHEPPRGGHVHKKHHKHKKHKKHRGHH